MRLFWRRARDRRGAVAVEFALITPILITILLALTDVTDAVIDWWRLTAAAGAIARVATNEAAQPDNTNVLTLHTDQGQNQVWTASTAVFALFPALAAAPASSYGVTISSVVMTPSDARCTSDCTYVGKVAWSMTPLGAAPKRPCGQLAAVPDGSPSTPATLPLDAFTPAPVLVVDVTYDFTPIFITKWLFQNALHFTETAYLAPRTGDNSAWTRLTAGAKEQAASVAAAQCPGYTG